MVQAGVERPYSDSRKPGPGAGRSSSILFAQAVGIPALAIGCGVLEVTENPNQTKQARREERLERTMIWVQDVLAWIGFLIGTLWAAGAIYYDGPYAEVG
jgi:hypothetical protein